MQPADAVLKFLESVGRRSDAEFYLQLFRAEPKERFATIAVDATTLEQGMDAVLVDLRFLNALELTPVVVLGLHHPERAPENTTRLRTGLEDSGIRAVQLESQPATALAGRVRDAARAGAIPVVTLAGASEHARIDELGRLLSELQTRKLVFLRREGGLEVRGAPVSLVNLTRDWTRLLASDDLSEEQRHVVRMSHHLVFQAVQHRLVVSLTSPINLLHELFTVSGAGTLLRRGAEIACHAGLGSLDRVRLKGLLESGFDRELAPDFLDRTISRAYVEEGYRGAALVVDTALGGYLTKVAVTREAQGEGIGSDLWHRLTGDYPTLIWRARQENSAANWYDKLCDGFVKQGRWTVYFRGLDPRSISEAIDYALAQPIDFSPTHAALD